MMNIGNEWEELLLSKMGTSIEMSLSGKLRALEPRWLMRIPVLKHSQNITASLVIGIRVLADLI